MKKRQKLEIFVSYIKDYHIFKSKVLKQYVIGNNNKGVEDRLKLPRDNTGINISEKNPTFNELTLIYWAWKNTNQDFIGFAHYRRYFVYNNLSFFDKLFFRFFDKYFDLEKIKIFKVNRKIKKFEKNIEEEIKNYDIILPTPIMMSRTLEEQYGDVHFIDHYNEMGEVIKEKNIKMYLAYERASNKNTFFIANMFIFKREIFEKYCEFVFDVLFELERRIKVPKDTYQSRVFGYLAERLTTIYIEYLTHEFDYDIKYLDIINTDYELGIFNSDEIKLDKKKIKSVNKKTNAYIDNVIKLNNKLFLIFGWGIVENEDSYNFDIKIEVYNSKNSIFYKTRPIIRKDVTKTFSKLNKKYNNYDDSGFNFIIDTTNLDIGSYKIKVLLHDRKSSNKSTHYVIDKYFEIKKEKKLFLKEMI